MSTLDSDAFDRFEKANKLRRYIQFADEFNVDTTYRQRQYKKLVDEIIALGLKAQYDAYCATIRE